MKILPHVFRTTARAISLAEFADAIRATCPPRFPKARGELYRQVGLAVSGGVDSMALAYLCTKLRQQDHSTKISDNPISSFSCIVVDHGIREGSLEEAHTVAGALRAMNASTSVESLNWTAVLRDRYSHPKELPNFESVARRLRYRRIAAICAQRRIASLLLAHHEDDQYETVLMRLLQGRGGRGLRGMMKANNIPECEGIHGAYQSGYVDDQKRAHPYYNYGMPKGELKVLRQQLRSTIGRLAHEEEMREMMAQDMDRGVSAAKEEHDYGLKGPNQSKRVISHDVENIEVEDGGVMIYRPLLEFSKDRLIATCLENNIPWWEDQTNHDATLTLRNAVRYLYKGHDLPKALQKPAILDLSGRCQRRVQAYEAAANRLLSRAVIHDFVPTVGTSVVQFPRFKPPDSRREMRSPERQQARISQQREVAGILIQKTLALVSPEPQTPPLINLRSVIPRLFPSLANPSEAALARPAKAFSIAGVHLIPMESNLQPSRSAALREPINWYLSRTPYPSNQPLPRFRMPYWSTERDNNKSHSSNNSNTNGSGSGDMNLMVPQRWPWSKRMKWKLWDNRFWIRMTHRLPYRVFVQPFAKEHAKPLREQLHPDDRARLAALLKRYAPGKVRYTLPAIYLEEDLDLENVSPRPDYPIGVNPAPNLRGFSDISKSKLLALPTLDVQIPRLDKWLHYEVRYRRVDRGTFETAGTFHRGSFTAPAAAAVKAGKFGLRRRG